MQLLKSGLSALHFLVGELECQPVAFFVSAEMDRLDALLEGAWRT